MDVFSTINIINKKIDYSLNQTQDVREVHKTSGHLHEKKSEEERKELHKVVDDLNTTMNTLGIELRFKFDDKADELVVQAVDKKSDKVIREYPEKEMLVLKEHMKDLIGLLYNEKG